LIELIEMKAAGILEFIEVALDDVSQGIDGGIDWKLLFSVALGGDHCKAAALLYVLADEVRIIAFVCMQDFCIGAFFIHERMVPFEVGDFAARERRRYREAQSVDAEMDLGRKATV
jgi:hypothetical protein